MPPFLRALLQRLAPLRPIVAPFLVRRGPVLLGAGATIGAALALLSMPVLAGRALDAARGGDAGTVTTLAAAFAAAAIFEGALRMSARRLLIGASRRAEESLKARIAHHIARLPVPTIEAERTGDLISRLTQDVELLRFVTGPLLLYGAQAAIVVPGGVAIVMRSSVGVAAGAAILFVAMVVALRRLSPLIERRSTRAQEALAAISDHAAERAVGIRVLQVFHRMVAEDRAMRELAGELATRGYAVARLQAVVNAVIHLAVELVVLVGLVFGAIEVARGRSTPGALLEYWALLGVQLGPLMALGFVFSGMPRALAAGRRVERILELPMETDAGEGTIAGPGRIHVRGLTFRHAPDREPILRDVSFDVEPGTTLGIVGPVGSGKSTILDLLLRLREPPPGALFVDGVDVLTIAPAALRGRFAVALQDPFLFSDTIANNVRLGRDAADVGLATSAAGLDPDLASMPSGTETVVGERGVTLSGGQRQRVALARALASDRPVLALDDTLSAVDHATEARILANLRTHAEKRTTIVVTHRLSAVRDADRILVLDEGRVVGFGPHHELLRDCPQYAETWRRQREHAALESSPEAGTT